MPRRITWIVLAALPLMLTLGSCASNEIDCPTCPPANSGRLTVLAIFDTDSAQVSVDGGATTTIFNNTQRVYTDLSRGVHSVRATLFTTVNFVTTATVVTLNIQLEQGESRTVLFHHNFGAVVHLRPARPSAGASLRAG